MKTTAIVKKSESLIKDNSAAILTGVGVVGTVGTAVLTGRATFKAAQVIFEAEQEISFEMVELDTKTKVKMVAPLYIPPVLVGTGTIAAIIMANHVSSKRAAALAVAYGLGEKRFQEYREKVEEKLGVSKSKTIRDNVAQDRVAANPEGQNIVIISSGDVLCYDMYSGRYFQSSMEKIRKAENTINAEILNHQIASLSSFYEEVGLEPAGFSDEIGFNSENLLELHITTTKDPQDRPCLAIDFNLTPKPDYTRNY